MNTNQKESLLIMAVAAALLIYLNIPQWLLCYIRPSFIVTTNTGGFVNSIIFVADKNQDLENDIQETFDTDTNTATIDTIKITDDSFAVIKGMCFNTPDIKIILNEKTITDIETKVNRKESNFLEPKYFLAYDFRARLTNLKKGSNTLKLITINKYLSNKETKEEYKIIVNNSL